MDSKVTVNVLLGIVAIAALMFLSINIGRSLVMDHKIVLAPYTGVGSDVYKHGTIIRVMNGKPAVIGHFTDDSGKTWPGTWEVK